jgi:hypothetical protein
VISTIYIDLNTIAVVATPTHPPACIQTPQLSQDHLSQVLGNKGLSGVLADITLQKVPPGPALLRPILFEAL